MPTQDDGPEEDDYRQTYNFAPGYYGLVYRADDPDYHSSQYSQHQNNEPEEPQDGEDVPPSDAPEHAAINAGVQDPVPERYGATNKEPTNDHTDPSDAAPKLKKYKLQAMKWGLVPFWTKRNPDYSSTMRTINCRDDSLATPGGMWNTMKQNKRCIILAQGFYEWLKKPQSPKEKIPHFVKRKDGQLMCFAGLFDRVVYEDGGTGPGSKGTKEQPLYTYTVITTDSNKQLNFLHDRMPVILEPGSPELFLWLDNTGHNTYSVDLQALLKPYSGELECYPVSKEVGKVGNNSPAFIVPVNSADNKQNIANFFGNAERIAKTEEVKKEAEDVKKVVEEHGGNIKVEGDAPKETVLAADTNEENNAPLPVDTDVKSGIKREHDEDADDETSKQEDAHLDKAPRLTSPVKTPANVHKRSRNALSNNTVEKAAAKKASPAKASDGSKKITSFFGH